MSDSCQVQLNGQTFEVAFSWKMVVSTADKHQCVVCGTKSKTENTFFLSIELIKVVNTETGAERHHKPKAERKVIKAMNQTEADKPHCERCMMNRKFSPGYTMSHIWKGAWDEHCAP